MDVDGLQCLVHINMILVLQNVAARKRTERMFAVLEQDGVARTTHANAKGAAILEECVYAAVMWGVDGGVQVRSRMDGLSFQKRSGDKFSPSSEIHKGSITAASVFHSLPGTIK